MDKKKRPYSIVASLHPMYFSMSDKDKEKWIESLLDDVVGPPKDGDESATPSSGN